MKCDDASDGRAQDLRVLLGSVVAIALDVDGVLTDGTFWWGPNGEEWKRFSFADVMGVSLATHSGIRIALISGEDSPLVDRYAVKMRVDFVAKGCKDKAAALAQFAEQHSLELAQTCFMGDDVNDIAAMEIAGVAAAPANARPAALRAATFVSSFPGGAGAVRELVDSILSVRAEHDSARGKKMQ